MGILSEVGNTPLIPLKELGGVPLVAEVLIKDESVNPTGTHKDRKSAWLLERAMEDNADTLAILTSGNAGYSLATLAEGTGIRVVTIVSKDIRPAIKKSLESTGATVVEVDLSEPLDSEDIIRFAQESHTEKVWDVTNEGTPSYRRLYEEVASQNADIIICPIGSGELYMGICNAINEQMAHALVTGVQPFHYKQGSKADKLTSGHLPTMINILRVQDNGKMIGHSRHNVLEEDVQWCIDHAPEFLNAEPSALVALDPIRKYLGSLQKKIIVISTGKGKVEG